MKELNTTSNYFSKSQNKDYYLKSANFNKPISTFDFSEIIKCNFEIGINRPNSSDNRILVRFCDQYGKVLFACETKIINNKDKYCLYIKENVLVKGYYFISCIIYQPAVVQYDVVEHICNFSVVNNNASFAHLENFDIGNVYTEHTWE